MNKGHSLLTLQRVTSEQQGKGLWSQESATQRTEDSLKGLQAKKEPTNKSKQNGSTSTTARSWDSYWYTFILIFEHMPLSFPFQRHSSVPSCLPSSSSHQALLEGTSLLTASWEGLQSPEQPQPPPHLLWFWAQPPAPHGPLSNQGPTSRSLLCQHDPAAADYYRRGCICLTGVFQWQTSPLRKIYQTEMWSITEFIRSKAVTSVSQSAEC